MANVNKVILIGRLGNTPELKYTTTNHAVTELRLAVSRSFTGKDGQRQEKTDWFSVEVWDKQAENAERYLQKGREVYVEGRLATDEWVEKDSGQKRTKIKIVADTWQFIGSRGDGEAKPEGGGGRFEGGGGGGADRRPPNRPTGPAPGMGGDPTPEDFGPDDDIPF